MIVRNKFIFYCFLFRQRAKTCLRWQRICWRLFFGLMEISAHEGSMFRAFPDKPLSSWRPLSIKKCNQLKKEIISLQLGGASSLSGQPSFPTLFEIIVGNGWTWTRRCACLSARQVCGCGDGRLHCWPDHLPPGHSQSAAAGKQSSCESWKADNDLLCGQWFPALASPRVDPGWGQSVSRERGPSAVSRGARHHLHHCTHRGTQEPLQWSAGWTPEADEFRLCSHRPLRLRQAVLHVGLWA